MPHTILQAVHLPAGPGKCTKYLSVRTHAAITGAPPNVRPEPGFAGVGEEWEKCYRLPCRRT